MPCLARAKKHTNHIIINNELVVVFVLHACMAFFGLPERELPIGSLNEHIAEYTWGEDSYDSLGDALQEARDDLNDETFGSAGPVGQYYLFFLFFLRLSEVLTRQGL